MNIQNDQWSFKNFNIPITHYKLENPKGILVVFPGGGYSCFGPLLYYPTNLYMDQGFDVLLLEYDFRRFKVEGDKDHFFNYDGV